MDIVSWLLSRKYTDMSIVGLGSIRGANCTISDIVHQDGINTVTFKWTGTDGTEKTRDMVVYDGTPIYVWESGNTYHYGDLAIYESQFYRCIVENNDVTFDSTKWNEIGSPDGNYDIVQSVNLLPARFTAADRKLYYVIDENCFYLWNGTAWVKTISNKIADLDDVNLDDLTEGDVLVWDSVNEKWVNKAKFDEYKTTFVGTQAQWDALTPAQQDVYKIINITDDGEVINLGVYLEKKAVLPTANADNVGTTYIYTGASNANYKKGACYECQHIGQTYTWVQVSVSKDDFNALGTASAKNYTSNVRPNNTDLVESQAVYSAINNALASIYVPRGDLSCAELTSDLLIPANVGNVYTMSDSGTTTALFMQGAGISIPQNSTIGIIQTSPNTYLFNLMGNTIDLHDYQKKDLTSAVEGQTTVEGALGALSTNKQAKTLSTSVESQTTVEGALSALSTNKATQAEVNDIVNVLGAKNVLPFPYYEGSGTYNGVTITDNGDGSITLDGTCTGMSFFVFYGGRYSLAPTTFVKKNEDYIATLEVVSGSMAINSGTSRFVFRNYITNATSPFVDIFYEDNVIDTRSVKFTYEPTASYDTSLVWYEFNVGTTFNNWRIRPMIRLASIQDDTYEPYAKTNQQLTKETTGLLDNLEVNGAVNMLPNNATSQTVNGITFTVNDDGSVTANGTSTGYTSLVIAQHGQASFFDDFIGKPIKLSGCLSGGASNTYKLRFDYASGNYVDDVGEGVIITPTAGNSNTWYVEIGISGGVTVSNLTFKPMITVPSYNGDYVPYAKSNKELTKNVEELSTNATKLVGLSTPVSIFDVLTDRSLYPSSNAYWATAAKLTNGNNTFSSLLSINDNAIVRIDVYSEWYIGIEINDASHGNALIAWANKTTTQLKFIQINTSTSPYVSQVTINKAP